MCPSLDPDAVPNWLRSVWPPEKLPQSVLAGIDSDDCAALQWTDGLLVATMDFLNARPIATQLGLGTGFDLGRLLVAANLSDLCGSGARPVALLIGAMMEKGTELDEFQEIIRGVKAEADRWGVPVIGGDTKLGPSRVLVATALGEAPSREHLFLRNAARSGDLLWVSGEIGSCTAAVIGLGISEMSRSWQQWAKQAILEPRLPLLASKRLSEGRLGRGGTDLSDGLGADLQNLCQTSGVGVVLNVAAIPLAAEVREVATHLGIPPWSFAFGIGGDFQFVVTSDRSHTDTVQKCGLTLIGEITESQDCVLALPDGSVRPMPIGGHRDHRNVSFRDEALSLVKQALGEMA